jgi:FkbM family methyltransferase
MTYRKIMRRARLLLGDLIVLIFHDKSFIYWCRFVRIIPFVSLFPKLQKAIIDFPENMEGIVEISHSNQKFSYWVSTDDSLRFSVRNNLAKWEVESRLVFHTLCLHFDRVIDVGAHRGIFGLIGLRTNPDLKVLFIEPSSANREILNLNLKLNHFNTRAEILPFAASNFTGTLSLKRDASSPKIPSMFTLHGEGEVIEQVKVSTLDDLALNFEPQVIKIDAEGSDFDILQGSKKVIGSYEPIFLVESNSELDKKNISNYLSIFGYTLLVTLDNRNLLFISPKYSWLNGSILGNLALRTKTK